MPSYLYSKKEIPTLLVNIHAGSLLMWFAICLAQNNLHLFGLMKWHRQIGYRTAALVALILASSVKMILWVVENSSGILLGQFLFTAIVDLGSFSLFYILALYFRKNTKRHISSIIMASLSLMPPALVRFFIFYPQLSVFDNPFDSAHLVLQILILVAGFLCLSLDKKRNDVFIFGSLLVLVTRSLREVLF